MDASDILGKRFGRLTVLRYLGLKVSSRENHGRSYYKCRCDCGKEVEIQRHQLISGKRSSCGDCCRIIKEYDHYRYYDINGDSFIFDADDLSLVKEHRWRIDSYGYPITRIKGQNYRLPRMIMMPAMDEYVDHLNGDTRDTRRSNLRTAKAVENQRNMRIPKHNTSGFKGVTYVSSKKKYRAQISTNNRTKHIGYYTKPEQAARAYDKAARSLFGEFACVNFPEVAEQGCRPKEKQEVGNVS